MSLKRLSQWRSWLKYSRVTFAYISLLINIILYTSAHPEPYASPQYSITNQLLSKAITINNVGSKNQIRFRNFHNAEGQRYV